MSIESDARAVFGQVRTYYMGTIKAINKIYDPTRADQRKHANWVNRLARYNAQDPKPLNAFDQKIQAKCDELRALNMEVTEYDWAYEMAFGLKSHYDSAPRAMVAGNCGEMCILAFWYILKSGFSWNVSMIKIGDDIVNHAFCCMGDMRPFEDYEFESLARIQMSQATIPWVIDPWANCCCPLNEYPEKLDQKMAKWHGDGKMITAPHNPPFVPTHYVKRCLNPNKKIQIELNLEPMSAR